MEYKKFEKIILNLQKSYDQANILYENGVDITEATDALHIIISDLLGIIFTDDGKDWIDWFMYEKEFGKREDLKAWDVDKNEIAYDIKSLYELLINGYYNKN
jgi:hypothetical protein